MMFEHHTARTNPVEVGMTKAIVKQCRTCGKSYASSKDGGYCSMGCYRAAQRAGAYAGLRPIKESRIHTCAHCGADVRGVNQSKRRNGEPSENVFCSRKCYDDSRTKVRNDRAQNCEYCGNSYIRHTLKGNNNKRFCSSVCRFLGLKAEPRNCVNCGCWMTPIKLNASTGKYISSSNGKVCSRECHLAWIRNNPVRKAKISAAFTGEKHPNWQGGKLFLNHRSTWDRLADSIRDRDGHRCRSCGKSETDNRRRLDVHHIVPRRECLSAEIADHPENLISLCDECHMRVEWEGGQKRGTRRKAKRCKKVA